MPQKLPLGYVLPALAYAGFSLLPALVVNAQAQEPHNLNMTPHPTDPQAMSLSLTLPPGPLAQRLVQFAEQTGTTLSYPPAAVEGLHSPGVQSADSIAQAMEQLLDGTGMEATTTTGGYVVQASGTSDVGALESMTVYGTRIENSGVAPVSGYLARLSRTATRADTPLLETPRSISVVTADQIADRKSLSVEDAVAYTPGVSIGGSGLDPRYDQINVRGYDTTTNGDFLDGLRQPNSGWLSYFASDPYALERIEILKGPASVLYGQISPGGMVNRVSKRPTATPVQEVEVQAGNYQHRQAQFDIGGSLDDQDTQLYRLVGVLRDAETSVEQVDNDIGLLAPSFTWQLDDATRLTLLGQYLDRQTSGSPRPYQDGETLTDLWAGDEDFDRLDQQQLTLGYEFEHNFQPGVSVHHRLRYGDVDTTNQYLSVVGAQDDQLDRISYGVYEDMQSVTSDTWMSFDFDTGPGHHTLLTGFDYAWLDYDVQYATGDAPTLDRNNPDHHQHVSRPDSLIADLSGESQRYGAYLQDQLAIGNWRLSAGLRHDWVETDSHNHLSDTNSTRRDSETSAQVGALYAFEWGLSPYISYATSFLPQSGTNVYGQQYEPTEGEQFEVGVKYQRPGSDTLLTLSTYQITQSNVLTRDPDNPLNRLQVGEERSRGIELEAISQLTEDLRLTASYSINDAEVTKSNDGNEGKTPINTPRELASLWLNHDLSGGPLNGLGMSAGVRYVGDSYSDSANHLTNDDYTLVDAGVYYDFSGNLAGTRLALYTHNLLDEQYEVCESGYCYRGEGRVVIGSLRYQW